MVLNMDPLSGPTHKARAYLLGLSVAGILTRLYGLTIKDIPLSGLEMPITGNVVPLALTIGIGYFLAAFAIYATDDVINLSDTPFQVRVFGHSDNQRRAIQTEAKEAIFNVLRAHSGGFAMEIAKKFVEILSGPTPPFGDDMQMTTIFAKVAGQYRDVAIPHTTYSRISKILADAKAELDAVDLQYPKNATYRYALYRKFRVWGFDLGLPPLVAIAALTIMWWPA